MKAFEGFGDGAFASVASVDGRAYLAFQTDPRAPESAVRIYDLGTEKLVRAYLCGGGAAFPLLKPTGAPLMVAWRRADSGRIHYAQPLVDEEKPSDLGDVGANNEPFAWDGDWLWWQDASFQIKRANVVTGIGRETMAGQVGRGTGIARIVAGKAILRDFDRIAYGLTFPDYAAGHVALEGNTGGLVVVRERDRQVARVWAGLDCFAPKIGAWNDGVIAATSGSGSVRAVVLAARDFADGPIVLPDPGPPPTPPPPPEPPKETRPMRMPDAVYDTIAAFYARFGTPEGEEAQRAHHGRCCETVRARHGAEWGWKRADAGRPLSADAIAALVGGRLFVWDCVRDAGGPERAFTLSRGAEGEDVTGQVFVPVSPIDHLSGGTVPGPVDPPPPTTPPPTTPPPTTPPPTGTDLAAVHAKLDAILAELRKPIAILRT